MGVFLQAWDEKYSPDRLVTRSYTKQVPTALGSADRRQYGLYKPVPVTETVPLSQIQMTGAEWGQLGGHPDKQISYQEARQSAANQDNWLTQNNANNGTDPSFSQAGLSNTSAVAGAQQTAFQQQQFAEQQRQFNEQMAQARRQYEEQQARQTALMAEEQRRYDEAQAQLRAQQEEFRRQQEAQTAAQQSTAQQMTANQEWLLQQTGLGSPNKQLVQNADIRLPQILGQDAVTFAAGTSLADVAANLRQRGMNQGLVDRVLSQLRLGVGQITNRTLVGVQSTTAPEMAQQAGSDIVINFPEPIGTVTFPSGTTYDSLRSQLERRGFPAEMVVDIIQRLQIPGSNNRVNMPGIRDWIIQQAGYQAQPVTPDTPAAPAQPTTPTAPEPSGIQKVSGTPPLTTPIPAPPPVPPGPSEPITPTPPVGIDEGILPGQQPPAAVDENVLPTQAPPAQPPVQQPTFAQTLLGPATERIRQILAGEIGGLTDAEYQQLATTLDRQAEALRSVGQANIDAYIDQLYQQATEVNMARGLGPVSFTGAAEEGVRQRGLLEQNIAAQQYGLLANQAQVGRESNRQFATNVYNTAVQQELQQASLVNDYLRTLEALRSGQATTDIQRQELELKLMQLEEAIRAGRATTALQTTSLLSDIGQIPFNQLTQGLNLSQQQQGLLQQNLQNIASTGLSREQLLSQSGYQQGQLGLSGQNALNQYNLGLLGLGLDYSQLLNQQRQASQNYNLGLLQLQNQRAASGYTGMPAYSASYDLGNVGLSPGPYPSLDQRNPLGFMNQFI